MSTIRTFFYVFCNPLDRDRTELEFRRAGLDGAIWVTPYCPAGKPVIEQEDYDLDSVGRVDMVAKLKDRFFAWYSAWYTSPQAPNEIRLPMPHATQKTLIYSPKRFKVMVCGRRYGKTTAALIKAILRAASAKNQVIFYIAPTYRQAKQNAWGMLNEFVGQAYSRRNEQELFLEFANGSRIYLKGADNPDGLRGSYVHLAILDEYQDIRPGVFDRIIRPMVADTKGEVWFIGTPKGFNHFHELFTQVASGSKGPDWQAYRLTSYDNPHLDKAEIEQARRESDPRAFAQEWMAEFVQFEGLVYPDFKRAIHVKTFDVDKIDGVDLVGIDAGADHPTAGIFARITSTNSVYIWGEHYRLDASARDHADDLKVIRGKRAPRRWYIDPSAKQFAKDLKTCGIATTPAINDRIYGISELRALLRTEKLYIHPSCSNLIYEFEHHRYKSETGKTPADVDSSVLKVDDDALDALRYLVASHFKGKTYKDSESSPIPYDPPSGAPIEFDRINLDNNAGLRYNMDDVHVAPEFSAYA